MNHLQVVLMKLYFSSSNSMKIFPYPFPIPFAFGNRQCKTINKALVRLSLFLLKNNSVISVNLFLSLSQMLFSTFFSTISGSKSTETTINKSDNKGRREDIGSHNEKLKG